MREILCDELKRIELGILEAVHDFCAKNELRYYLCGGTLLGAVRHGGFIPWDDDIDICMPRDDYEKFVAAFDDSGNYEVLSYPKSSGYFLPFAKVCDKRTVVKETVVKDVPGCGVYIDVFPLDGLSDDINCARKILKRNKLHMKINAVLLAKNAKIDSFKGAAKWIVQHTVPQKKAVARIVEYSRRISFEGSKYVGVAFGFYGEREILDRTIFTAQVEIAFENKLFYAPSNADKYLTSLYGNYMELPPVEKRVTHHSFVPYWKE